MTIILRLFCLLLFIASTSTLHAQRGWEIGGWGGVSYYFGDLNTNYRLNRPKLAGGAIARYNINKRLCLSLTGNVGSVEAYDSDSKVAYEIRRNLHFKSLIIDGALRFEFNFLPYTHGSTDEWFTPYIFGGLSVFSYNPKAKNLEGEWIALRELGTEGQFLGEEYYTITSALAYGVGMKFDLSYDVSLNLEISARKPSTDYIDDVSTVYTDLEDLGKLRGPEAVYFADPSIPDANGQKIGEPGRQRGNSKDKDIFMFLKVGIVYYFGDIRCPRITRNR